VTALLAAALAAAAVLLGWPPRGRGPVSSVAAPAPAPPARPRWLGRWRPRRPDGHDGDLVADLAERLAALLRAGMPPSRAWAVLAATGGPEAGVCARVMAGLAAGSTITSALRAAGDAEPARSRSAARLRWLAIAWDVVERTGAPAAAVLDELADGLRAEGTAAAERDAALAGPKATAALLAALPPAALALGALAGADPVQALLGTAPGRVSLLLGLSGWALGWYWTRRLLAAAAR
jgi:tight adherence protein B